MDYEQYNATDVGAGGSLQAKSRGYAQIWGTFAPQNSSSRGLCTNNYQVLHILQVCNYTTRGKSGVSDGAKLFDGRRSDASDSSVARTEIEGGRSRATAIHRSDWHRAEVTMCSITSHVDPRRLVGMKIQEHGARDSGVRAGEHRREILQRRFQDRPLLVFWEMTKACDLACSHCRADAQSERGPRELTTEEGRRMIDSLAVLASPRPILILTGGDCLKRPDLVELVDYARAAQLPVALAPSVTPLLTRVRMDELRRHGISTVSISLDGMDATTHDAVRGVQGHFTATMIALNQLKDAGFTVQINTTVMATNVEQLADVAKILRDLRIDIWEVFFLIPTGRGIDVNASSPQQNEDICNFLVDASQYGFVVRAVEGPFLRRVSQERQNRIGGPATSELYGRLAARLRDVLGPPTHDVCAPSAATRDGNGIVFVGATGDVYPSGFLPLAQGNVRQTSLIDIYRDSPIMKAIRDAAFHGVCGQCASRQLCGGSRSRAFAVSGDPLGSDPACILVGAA